MNKKLMKLMAVVSASFCALVLLSFLAYNMVRNVLIEENEALVQSVAQSILPALLVNDTLQVEALLKALEKSPCIDSAELISAEGASIASYAKAGPSFESTYTAFELASAHEDPNQVHMVAPITFDSLIVANLHIAVNLWPTYLRIIIWLGIFLIVPSAICVLLKQLRIKIRFEKNLGRNDFDQGEGPFDINKALSTAMHDADISLEFQPIQRMSDGGIFGMEAVICWRHPSGQTLHISPSNFVAVAKKIGICLPFDDWLLRTACTHAATWQHQYGPLILTINIDATQFSDPTFAQKVRLLCEQTQYPHQLLELELNESVIACSTQHIKACFLAFAKKGLSITVDGFGLEKNSLELLKNLPINKVKLDPKLIKRMSSDSQIFLLVQTTIAQALSHHVQVMVAGLETAIQHTELQRLGCNLGQGAYFHQPLTASAFEAFLAARTFDGSISHDLSISNKRNTQDVFSSV